MMSTTGRGELMVAVLDAQRALHLNQEELARVLGSSLRTVQRWYAGRAPFYPDHLTKLVFAVYQKDAEVAGRLAAFLGQSLESLGVVAPPPPAAVLPAPAPGPPPPPPPP
ncbi:MAG: antitoxin Xre-like helix-turn-helix domain-containing protein, partial [Polyangiaceae bacterium]